MLRKSAFLFGILLCTILIPKFCFSREFPDVGGILDFSKPESISNQLFILTNPKSGSHLLLYSIMKITQRPLRGRLPIWHFENDPPCFPPENMMEYPLNFSKPTTYWGHEYHLLKPLNRSGNKLIFILRNYKENISSQLMLKNRSNNQNHDLGDSLLNEILNEGMIFKEYLLRLQLFDSWDPSQRCLVLFDDLIMHPEYFIPDVMSFIGDNSEYLYFIDHYDDFKNELMERYRKKGNSTGSGSTRDFFSKKISIEILQIVDDYVRKNYPTLWNSYLMQFEEPVLPQDLKGSLPTIELLKN